MSDVPAGIPEDYEIIKTIDISGPVSEHIARHKTDNTLVRLKTVKFDKTSSVTTRRHLREYLRCDITFMEELELGGVIRVIDYSDTKELFWIATEPAEVDKLSKRFDFLSSQSLKFRQDLVLQFLEALTQIHNSQVVHRNLSTDAVFLSSKLKIYIGEFGFASYFTDGTATGRQDTTYVTTMSYQPPEVRNAKTFTCNVSGDIFSAGLLVFEILAAEALPKDDPAQIDKLLHTRLNEQMAKEVINVSTKEVILKAVSASPEKRWQSAGDFAVELERSFQGESARGPLSFDPYSTVAVNKAAASDATAPVQTDIDSAPPTQLEKAAAETTDTIKPLDPSHEIWNNRYEIIEKIGEGGQAVVYKAFDHLTNEEVAIKTMWSRHREDRSAINRLKQGAMIARSLTHRYIIKTYSVEQRIEADGPSRFVFVCMELIKSKLELADVIEERRTMGKKIRLDETLHISRQLLDALIYAHEYTIHRDIKPGNIMLVPKSEQAETDTSDLTKFDIRLIDFGIAKVLSQKHIDVTGKGFRSAHYGAPELGDAKGGVDARADIYSAGVIMYQMLTLNIPRKGSPSVNKVNKDVPAALAQVIDKAINAEREKRYKTASEFAKEIDRAVSKFSWLRKTAKMAAVLLAGVCAAAAVKYFMPQPEYGSVAQSIEVLENRAPSQEIAAFADDTVIRNSDIEGYSIYENLRKTAIENLKIVKMAGNTKFNKKDFSPWKQQEDVWVEIEPAARKIENIAEDLKEYNARKELGVADYLMKLSPSSKIIAEVKEKTQKAEMLLEARPISPNILDICADSYDLGAKVYTNIDNLAGNAEAPEAARKINDKLKAVEELRNSSLQARYALDTIDDLKDSDFQNLSDKCYEKADRYYQSFELPRAEQYFNLLSQICGTITYVKDEIDLNRSDIGLISSRLMDLCYEEIETFENYPEWKERLQQVYEKKEVLAKYKLIQTQLSKSPKDVPSSIYDLLDSALKQYEQGNITSASSGLSKTLEEYKKFIRTEIKDLQGDCDSLIAFDSVSAENIKKCKVGLEKLSNFIEEPVWPQTDFADEYQRCCETIMAEKEAVKKQLIQDARDLKKQIVESYDKSKQQNFFNSRLIDKYTAVARYYDDDNIDTSIDNWNYVENLKRLSAIVSRMQKVNSYLNKMLARKEQLESMSKDLVRAADFCYEFKGISAEERKKYGQWGADLKQLKDRLTIPLGNIYLIDQPDEKYAAEYKNIKDAFLEIRAKLPYHRSRVMELINKTQSLEKNAAYINGLQEHWSFILAKSVKPQKPDFSKIRTYLENIKEEVDKWSTESFNKQLQDECEMLADTLEKQYTAISIIISAVLDEKTKIIEDIKTFEKSVSKILSDEDIRMLNDITADDTRRALLDFRQLPEVLRTRTQQFSDINLNPSASSKYAISENKAAGFEVDYWLENFIAGEEQLDVQISQIKTIENTASFFQETRLLLARQSSIETEYYLGLRDSTTAMIDFTDLQNKINELESDKTIVRMCLFLKQIGNDTIPKLQDLKASVAAISTELKNLKLLEISSLTEAKNFNRKRMQLVESIENTRQNTSQLDRTNLENTCKESIIDAVNQIKNLIGNPRQTETITKLSSSLWSFFPEHTNWSQWEPFLKLYHIIVSGENIRLASNNLLSPANEKGNLLNLTEIAANFTELFYTDTGNPSNFGWPRYVSHQKDPTVILAFIPGAESESTGPFYMAVREITNSQYKLFLEETRAKSTTKLAGWSFFADQSNNLLIGQAQGQFPPCRITLDKSTETFTIDEEFKYAPVTWVTSYGAEAYAQWFNAQLPTVSQHTYASLANTNTSYPWGDDLSNAVSYAHIRSAAWQNAAREYNVNRDNPTKIAYPPVGAVKDFLRGKALDPAKITYEGSGSYPVWPCFTDDIKPNAWGLYDMVGNVWEWCIDTEDKSTPVICGGSCLSPPEYVRPDSKYEFDSQACDVGFRIVISAE